MDPVRVVTAEVTADCPFSTAQEYAEAFLNAGPAKHAEFEIRVPLPFLPTFIRHRVTMTFDVRRDEVEKGRAHDEIGVYWQAGTLLPNFCGTVRFRIAASGTLVHVDGSYRVPLGMAGALFDALVGTHIAHASATDLAARLRGYLEERQRTWRVSALAAMSIQSLRNSP
jgi:hypothetical protein